MAEITVEVVVLWGSTDEGKVYYLGVMGDYEEPMDGNEEYGQDVADRVAAKREFCREFMSHINFTSWWTSIEHIPVPRAAEATKRLWDSP